MKCDILKCKAACCYNVPLDKRLINVYKKRVVNEILRYQDVGGKVVIPITNVNVELNKCPFLQPNCRCAIYEQRPPICRDYGTNPKNLKIIECRFLTGKDSVPITEQEKLEAYAELVAKFTNLAQVDRFSRQMGLDWRE